jgi:hypothetical protein
MTYLQLGHIFTIDYVLSIITGHTRIDKKPKRGKERRIKMILTAFYYLWE